MLRAIVLVVTSLAFCAPAYAYSNALSRGVADFLNIFSEQPVPRQVVPWSGKQAPGTVVVSTSQRRLYYVLGQGQAIRYGVGVGRQGFSWSGTKIVSRKREWPDWRPPTAMLKRRPDLPRYMEGGMENPLGLYLRSLRALPQAIPPGTLVLPGHQLPFYGLQERCAALAAHHAERCRLIASAVAKGPHSVAELVPVMFTRPLDPHQLSFAFSEVFAHVNAMLRLGELRWAEPQGEIMKVMAAG